MRVLVTGGTGFVGSHVARHVYDAGYQVRMLVRHEERAKGVFKEVDVPFPEFVVGSVTDVSSVNRALEGCDGVVHAAATTPMKVKKNEELYDVNVNGTKNVVGGAVKQGVKSVVYISSITTIFNPDPEKVRPDAQVILSKMPFGKSKVEAELYVRELQQAGAPVSMVYPGTIIGPDDPGFSDAFKAFHHRINGTFRLFEKSGVQHIDVRDLAAFITCLLSETTTGRYLIPGHYLRWGDYADLIENISGCKLRRIESKGWRLRLLGHLFDLMRMFKEVDSPVSAESMRCFTQWPKIQNSEKLDELGITLRPPGDTFRDSLVWMLKAGYLQAEQVPKLEKYLSRWRY